MLDDLLVLSREDTMSPDGGARAGKVALERVTQRFVDELDAAKAPPRAKIALEEARVGHARAYTPAARSAIAQI